jgi:hypothetical protein
MSEDEDVMAALTQLREALQENMRRNDAILERIALIQSHQQSGRPWTQVVGTFDRPLIVEMLSQNIEVLTTAGARLRRAQARALHASGMSMERIAVMFGVTRQRISELLRSDADHQDY